MRYRAAMAWVVGTATVGVLAAGWTGAAWAQPAGTPTAVAVTPTAAPVTPTPGYESALVAQAAVGELPAGAATLSVTTVELPPGFATEPVANAGPVLIRVEQGSVTLDADEATVGSAAPPVSLLRPVPPTPGPAAGLVVAEGAQILVGAGATFRVTNTGTERALLTVVAVTGEGGGGGEGTEAAGTPVAGEDDEDGAGATATATP